MFFMIIIWILLPFCVSSIYNYFYTKHINKQMNNTTKKTWITPISVFFITFSLEFLIVALSVVKPDTTYEEKPIHMYNYSMYNETEINESIYSAFDGSEVNGYIKKFGSYKNFNYILYTCQYTLNTSPSYVLITDYVGNKEYLKDETTVIINTKAKDGSFSNTEITGITQNSNKIYHIIDPGNFQSININMYLFDKSINTYLFNKEQNGEEYDDVKELQKNAIEEFVYTIKEISQ